MDRHDPQFQMLVRRISAGELTREQAAIEAGVPLNTFKTWLRRSKAINEIKHTRRSAGVLHHNAEKDPDKVAAYVQAVDEALRAGSVRAVAKKYAKLGVNYPWLLHKVRQAREGSATLAAVPPKEKTL